MTKRNGTGMLQKAYTLFELLACIAIIAILAGVLLPMYADAKRQGHLASDIQRMRQLGLANNLYHDETGAYLGGCPDLVNVKRVAKEMCAAGSDPIDIGAANLVDESFGILDYRRLVVPYKNSFPGLREYGKKLDSKDAEKFPLNRGWLVRISSTQRGAPWMPTFGSNYQRLLYEGSVVTRKVVSESGAFEGRPAQIWYPLSLFGDKP